MTKIRLNEEDFKKLGLALSCFQEVFAIGLYGSFTNCLKLCEHFLAAKIDVDISITNLTDGIFAVQNGDRIAFVYKTNEEGFDFKQQVKILPHCSTYIRYLIDICQNIFAVTDEKFVINPDAVTPFQQKHNPTMTMSQVSVVEEEKKHDREELSVLEIPPPKVINVD